jgi:hypothetical protein
MSWTYSGNPGYSAKDQVRFLIGDTIQSDPILQDGEVDWLLSQYNNVPINAAIRACEAIISKFSRLADESVGQVKISFSQRCEGYRKTQVMLRNRLATEGAIPYAGGISISDKQAQVQNTDRVKPDFKKHMMENQQIAPWVTANELNEFLNLDA